MEEFRFSELKNMSLNKLMLMNKNVKRNMELINKRSSENRREEILGFDIFNY